MSAALQRNNQRKANEAELKILNMNSMQDSDNIVNTHRKHKGSRGKSVKGYQDEDDMLCRSSR